MTNKLAEQDKRVSKSRLCKLFGVIKSSYYSGMHYTSKKLSEAVASCHGMTQSMSCRGNCWDNAPTERFFRSFKTEWMPKDGYEDVDAGSSAIADYIWGYYQSLRPHRFNNYLPSAEKERCYFNKNLLSDDLI